MGEEQVTLAVRVRPGARKNEALDYHEGVLSLKIAAPPVEGKANAELVSYLSAILGIPKSRIELRKGATGRNKLLTITGLSGETLKGRIESLLAGKESSRQTRLL